MLRFVTTADTEILATAAAVERLPGGFPEVRCANPGGHADPAAFDRRGARRRARRRCAASSAAAAAGPRGVDLLRRALPRAAAASRCSRSAARPSPTPR